ncbi:hypothetical protein M8494_16840 [Serratia ureilytica]
MVLMIRAAEQAGLLAEKHQAEQQKTAENAQPISITRHANSPPPNYRINRNRPAHPRGDAEPNFFLGQRELNAHGGAGNQLSVLAVIGHSV